LKELPEEPLAVVHINRIHMDLAIPPMGFENEKEDVALEGTQEA